MGFIGDQHGQITIESRRESFYVHAGYGYEAEHYRLYELRLGATFVANIGEPELQVVGQHLNATFVKPVTEIEPGVGSPRDRNELVIRTENGRPNSEKHAPGAHAETWREHPHPEFLYEDLDDLIFALEELRERHNKKVAAR